MGVYKLQRYIQHEDGQAVLGLLRPQAPWPTVLLFQVLLPLGRGSVRQTQLLMVHKALVRTSKAFTFRFYDSNYKFSLLTQVPDAVQVVRLFDTTFPAHQPVPGR